MGKMERDILRIAWELGRKDAHHSVSINEIRYRIAEEHGKMWKPMSELEFERWIRSENLPPEDERIMRAMRNNFRPRKKSKEQPLNSLSASFYRSIRRLYEMGLFHYSPPEWRDLEKYYKGKKAAYFD